MSLRALEKLKEAFPQHVLETKSEFGDDTALVSSEKWLEIASFLKSDAELDFDRLVDLCAVDYPERLPRFEVVIHLHSISKNHRLRLKARVGDEEGKGAFISSLTSVWLGADWFERETFDMFGISFVGHPDLRRILMYPEFEGHPLRKDYPAEKTQPLVAYRTEEEAGVPLGKLAPFREDEGMSFGRQSHQWLETEDQSK